MTPIDFATRDELRELTAVRRKSGVAAMLNRMGVTYVLDASGWPKVARSQLRRLVDRDERVAARAEPDFAALDD